jgi:hypothetical protein
MRRPWDERDEVLMKSGGAFEKVKAELAAGSSQPRKNGCQLRDG